ncbi:hypothetical protein HG263_08365 [Pseudoalteromonas sp. JBTF-M23]|uniref:Uncharacterized protein n=1 Tax=Pseudoalteromonas caenipelagi TaxID=2726988 RepID=A0A849VF49_9GAMM|nr:hypothetical protein [Pseudoalteromonas caenipelagi]NOU50554.1 hypothetical protein [Pseudoalteromonas caenipelagi]
MSNTKTNSYSRSALKDAFADGQTLSSSQFEQLIDAGINQADDEIYAKDGKLGVGEPNPSAKVEIKTDDTDPVSNNDHCDDMSDGGFAALHIKHQEQALFDVTSKAVTAKVDTYIDGDLQVKKAGHASKVTASADAEHTLAVHAAGQRNAIAIVSGDGTAQSAFDAQGKLGIGITSPEQALEVAGGAVIGKGIAGKSDVGIEDGLVVEKSLKVGEQVDAKSAIAKTLNATSALKVGHTVNADASLALAGCNSKDALSIKKDDSSTESIIVKADGKVGIHTDRPTERFEVNSKAKVNDVLSAEKGIVSKDSVTIGDTNTPQDTPENGLSVQGDVHAQASLQVDHQLAIGGHPNTATSKLSVQSEQGQSPLNIATTDKTAALHVNEQGQVGVGTKTPAQQLDVQGNVDVSDTLYSTKLEVKEDTQLNERVSVGERRDDENARLAVRQQSSAPALSVSDMAGNANLQVGTPSSTVKIKQKNDVNKALLDISIDGGEQEHSKFKVTKSGKVGIGVEEPEQRLSVDGDAKISDGLIVEGQTTVDTLTTKQTAQFGGNTNISGRTSIGLNAGVEDDDNTDPARLFVKARRDDKYALNIKDANNRTRVSVGQGCDDNLVVTQPSNAKGAIFKVDLDNANEALRTRLSVDKSGNVGIGTAAPEAALDVNGKANLRKGLAVTGKTDLNDVEVTGTTDTDTLVVDTMATLQKASVMDSLSVNCDIENGEGSTGKGAQSYNFKVKGPSKLDGTLTVNNHSQHNSLYVEKVSTFGQLINNQPTSELVAQFNGQVLALEDVELKKALTVTGDTNLAKLTTTQNATLNGLTVKSTQGTAHTQLNGTLNTTGSVTFDNTLNVTGQSSLNNLTVSGTADLKKGLTVKATGTDKDVLAVTDRVDVTGDMSVTGTLEQHGLFQLRAASNAANHEGIVFDLTGDSTQTGSATINGGVTLTGYAQVNGTHTVTEHSSLNTLTAQSAVIGTHATDEQGNPVVSATVNGPSKLNGNVDVTGQLQVAQHAKFVNDTTIGERLEGEQSRVVVQGRSGKHAFKINDAEHNTLFDVGGCEQVVKISSPQGSQADLLKITAQDESVIKVIVDKQGWVGLNTDCPSVLLDVNGSAKVQNNLEVDESASIAGQIALGDFEQGQSAQARLHVKHNALDTHPLQIDVAQPATEGPSSEYSALTVDNQGRIGVGTDTPMHTLDVQGDAFIRDGLKLGTGNLDVEEQATVGKLEVTHTTTLKGKALLQGGAQIQAESGKQTALTTEGDVQVAAGENSSGALQVAGRASLNGAAQISTTDQEQVALTVDGTTSLQGNTEVTGGAANELALRVSQGETHLSGRTTISGGTATKPSLNVEGETQITGDLSLNKSQQQAGSLNADGYSAFKGGVHISADNAPCGLQNTLEVQGHTHTTSLLVDDKTTLNGEVCAAELTVSGATKLTSGLNASGPITGSEGLNITDGNSHFAGELTVCDKTDLRNGLSVSIPGCGDDDKLALEVSGKALFEKQAEFAQGAIVKSAPAQGCMQSAPALQVCGDAKVAGHTELEQGVSVGRADAGCESEPALTVNGKSHLHDDLYVAGEGTFGKRNLGDSTKVVVSKSGDNSSVLKVTDLDKLARLEVKADCTENVVVRQPHNASSDAFKVTQNVAEGGCVGERSNLVVNKCGLVGIHTDNPEYTLDVNGDARIKDNLTVEKTTHVKGKLHVTKQAEFDCPVNFKQSIKFGQMGMPIEGVSDDLSTEGSACVNELVTKSAIKTYIDEKTALLGQAQHRYVIQTQAQFDAVFGDGSCDVVELPADTRILLLAPSEYVDTRCDGGIEPQFSEYSTYSERDELPCSGSEIPNQCDCECDCACDFCCQQHPKQPAYILKNAVRLNSHTSIIGLDMDATRVVKAHAACRFIIEGQANCWIEKIRCEGWTFDGCEFEFEGSGGAFRLEYARELTLNCQLINHYVKGSGGAIYSPKYNIDGCYQVYNEAVEALHIQQCRAHQYGEDYVSEGGAAYGLYQANLSASECYADLGGAYASLFDSVAVAKACYAMMGGAAYHCVRLKLTATSCCASQKGGAAYECEDLICEGYWRGNRAFDCSSQTHEDDEQPRCSSKNIYAGGCYWSGIYVDGRRGNPYYPWNYYNC